MTYKHKQCRAKFKETVFLAPGRMAANEPSPYSLRLNRVFGPSLCPSKHWYAVSSEWFNRPRDFIAGALLKDEIAEVSIYDLIDHNGARVIPSWFGSNWKKDVVVVSTLFGILARALRKSNQNENKVLCSMEFKAIKGMINRLPIEEMARRNEFPANVPDTPPSSPEELKKSNVSPNSAETKTPFETLEYLENVSMGPRIKMRQTGAVAKKCVDEVQSQFSSSGCLLGKAFGYGFLYCDQGRQDYIRDTVSTALSTVAQKQGIRKAIHNMLHVEINQQYLESLRVPDWIQLYVKLSTMIPNRSWQTLLNFLNIGRTGKSTDVALLLTSNEMRAQKDLVFSITRNLFKLEPLAEELRGYGISLKVALIWQIRQSRLHQNVPKSGVLEFNLKLDGRPLAGREQVSVGVVPITGAAGKGLKGVQSAMAVFPIAVANCAEKRSEVKKLIIRLNDEKEVLKKEGICVDGKHYKITFKVTLDLKALYMLIVKPGDETFVLGGRGVDVEFCFLCHALRACKEHWGGSYDEVCLTCLQSKANIGKWSGIREDLTFLLDEELSSVCLCALHSEMRNTEQLLGSLGLFAYRCNALDECNKAISQYGPELSRGHDRITVKLRQGQQTAVNKNNISVASFSGNTERSILENIVDIIDQSLPLNKVISYYKDVKGASRDVVLGYVTFTNAGKNYLDVILQSGKFQRDYGKHLEEVQLEDAKDLKQFLENESNAWSRKLEDIEEKFLSCEQASPPKGGPQPRKRTRKRKAGQKIDHSEEENPAMAELAASLQISHFLRVFQEWKEIAKVVRSSQFEDSEDEQIDIFDIKCKLWGFLMRHLFGVTLGTGDYGHLTIDHSAMLLRLHRSLAKYSNQGFEASHKVHRALYSRATNHDQGGIGQSLDHIISHWLSEMMLFLRFQFRKANECVKEGKTKFFFRGCGWSNKAVSWSNEDKLWITAMSQLFDSMYGKDQLQYKFIQVNVWSS